MDLLERGRFDVPLGDRTFVPCMCGHLLDEHSSGFLNACTWCDDGECLVFEEDLELRREQMARDAAEYVTGRFTLEEAVAAVGIPVEEWKGQCYGIATLLHERLGLPGRVVYGHFLGRPEPGSYFRRRGFTQHGWIQLDDGTVIDPTRWVFENIDPYVFEGADDLGVYDEGGNEVARARMTDFPEVSDPSTVVTVPVSGAARGLLESWTGGAVELDMRQRSWVANLPYDLFEGVAREVYDALDAVGGRALIPVDNWMRAHA